VRRAARGKPMRAAILSIAVLSMALGVVGLVAHLLS
jgi:hypothetical protein